MDKFQESIVSLTFIRNNIERAVSCLYNLSPKSIVHKTETINNDNLNFTIKNHLMILLSSFQEELDIFISFGKNDQNVRQALNIITPALNQFKKWPGLYKIRSTLLAHNPRDKKEGNLLYSWNLFKQYKCPTTLEEVLLLSFCSLMITDNIKIHYIEPQRQAEEEILKMDRIIQEAGIATTIELENEFKRIQKEIEINKTLNNDQFNQSKNIVA